MESRPLRSRSLTCLELFSGIGGFAVVARRRRWSVLQALDIDQSAASVYRQNFNHEHQIRAIESVPVDELAALDADLWWLSPPCQPFTRRGARRGLADQRCAALSHLIQAIKVVKPRMVALENVPEFAASTAADRLRTVLRTHGYQFAEQLLCPTQLGVPNRRRRYYLVATLGTLQSVPLPRASLRLLAEYVEAAEEDLIVPADELARFTSAVDYVSVSDEGAVASCFTSAYGKSPVYAGSYLRVPQGMRRFSPREILRLLGFPEDFQWSKGLSRRRQWKLAGNSLSIPAVEHCLKAIGHDPQRAVGSLPGE